MPEEMDSSIHYTPEKECKYYRKEKKKEFCFLSDKHKNLNRCRICAFGHYKH